MDDNIVMVLHFHVLTNDGGYCAEILFLIASGNCLCGRRQTVVVLLYKISMDWFLWNKCKEISYFYIQEMYKFLYQTLIQYSR
jgi:hypothetical protein